MPSLVGDIRTVNIIPGKPRQNGANESFNGRFRDKCLSMEHFRHRAEASALIEAWWQRYNTVRPHCTLGGLTPAEIKDTITPSPNHNQAIPPEIVARKVW